MSQLLIDIARTLGARRFTDIALTEHGKEEARALACFLRTIRIIAADDL
jgi:broad specificity phosphatase PhoE